MDFHTYFETLTKPTAEFGGGSVAAVNGAMSAGLIIKGYNLLRKKNPDIDSFIPENFVPRLKILLEFFENKIKEDGEAFDIVLQAYKLPKNTDEEKAHRLSVIQMAYKTALNSPLEMMRKYEELYDLAYLIVDYTDVMSRSEIEIALNHITSGLYSARIGVEVNMAFIKDKLYKERIEAEIEEIFGRVN